MSQPISTPESPTSGDDFATRLRHLSRPCAFPAPVSAVAVHQTHISAVFVGGDLALKIKKPVKLPFLDFSSLPCRHFYCEEEVRINRSWAPGVYLSVIPVTQDEDGTRFQGQGAVVDWAVKMRRLSDADNLKSRLQSGTLTHSQLIHAAHRVASLHWNASRCHGDQAIEAHQEFRRRLLENWSFARGLPGEIVAPQVLKRLETLSNAWLHRCDEKLRQRAQVGSIRECHGDLRLEHLFLCPDQTPPRDVLIIDGIEFYPGLRRIDVVSDIAFLVMELQFAGQRELADVFCEAYFSQAEDPTGRELLPLYTAYRSAVRGKVAAILSGETEIDTEERTRARSRSRAHWLWSLSELEQPDRRPALILVSGLPGTGKSTLARGLAERAAIHEVLRTDVVRRELAAGGRPPGDDRYSPQQINRVYEECRLRAQTRLLAGERVVVDATFQNDDQRRSFLQLAIDCGVRGLWIECTAPAEVCHRRIDARHGDASEADWSVYQQIQKKWEPASDFTERFHASVATTGSIDAVWIAAQEVLRKFSLTM